MVALAHLLSHAYAEHAYDIDGDAWGEEDSRQHYGPIYGHCDVRIAEGLAQFYTRAVCEKIVSLFDAPLGAYDQLLAWQSDPFRSQLEWVADVARPGEVVRMAMLAARTRGTIEYGEFLAEVDEARSQVLERSRQFSGRSS